LLNGKSAFSGHCRVAFGASLIKKAIGSSKKQEKVLLIVTTTNDPAPFQVMLAS
jgi:hypothetical protein